MKRAEVLLVVVLRGEVVDLASQTRLVQGETRLSYRAPLLPLLSVGMTICGSAEGRPWEGYRVDAIKANADTGLVTAEMFISAQNPPALTALVSEWKAKGWR